MKVLNILTALNLLSPDVVQVPSPDSTEKALDMPTENEAARIARTLIARESLMNVNTLEIVSKVPVSFMEYYVDCDCDGDPYWLVVEIGSTFQNILEGSPYSFTVRVGDHPTHSNVNSTYPGGISSSPAGSPRVNFQGNLHYIAMEDESRIARLESCFTARHPDSRWWLPSKDSSPHRSRWAKIQVKQLYLIGGFGDRAYIGNVDAAKYHRAFP